jgi:hypothetical protein
VHEHLLFEPGGPLCIVQSTSSPNCTRFMEKT